MKTPIERQDDGETIRLWTIQSETAWDKLESTGTLRGDGRRIVRDFRPAYQWLISQMVEKIPGFQGGYPVWAWVEPKPDLRNSGHLERGKRGVRITCDVPRDQVLLSGFDAWHSVLNNMYCSLTEAEADAFWDRTDRARQIPGSEPNLDGDVVDSWQRIFDINLLRQHPDWNGSVEYIQATLGQITLDQVVRVDHFVSR